MIFEAHYITGGRRFSGDCFQPTNSRASGHINTPLESKATMVEYFRQTAFISSVLAGFAFTFAGTLLVAAHNHRAAAWAAFFAMAASVAFLPVTLGMTFSAVHAANEPSAQSATKLSSPDSYIEMLSTLFLLGIVFLIASFGVSGWMRSRAMGVATTALSVIGAVAIFAALKPFLMVVHP